LSAGANYTIDYTGNNLTITPASLTITADNLSKTFGTTYNFLGTEFHDSGLVNGDTVSSVNLTSPGAAATASVAGSPYAITASNAAGTGLSNYTISYVNGFLSVTPVAVAPVPFSLPDTVAWTLSSGPSADCRSPFDSCLMPEGATDEFTNHANDNLDIRISPDLAAMLGY
jgi:hypothetical protein